MGMAKEHQHQRFRMVSQLTCSSSGRNYLRSYRLSTTKVTDNVRNVMAACSVRIETDIHRITALILYSFTGERVKNCSFATSVSLINTEATYQSLCGGSGLETRSDGNHCDASNDYINSIIFHIIDCLSMLTST